MSTTACETARDEQTLPPVVGQVESCLREIIDSLAPQPTRKGRGAPMVIPSLLLWTGVIVCLLRGFRSQAQLWRLLSLYGFWSYRRVQVSEQTVRNRLAEGGDQVKRLFEQITEILAGRLAPYQETDLASFATSVVALDQVWLDPVLRTLPMLKDGKVVAQPKLPGKLACRFDLRMQQWQKVEYLENPNENEKLRAFKLVEDLPLGSLILCDLGYFSFRWFDELTRRGHFWISRLREGTSYEVEHVSYEDGDTLDALIWLGKYRADRAGSLVRLVQWRVRGKLVRYITNVLEPGVLSMREIARLYGRRWDIEMGFKLIKRDLGLHLLWSSKPAVILQQVWGVLLISQVLQALRKEIAGRAAVDVFDVSMSLMIEAVPEFASRGIDPVQAIVEFGRQARIIRASRRIKMQAPTVPEEAIIPVPEGLIRERKARYANRKCGPRPTARKAAAGQKSRKTKPNAPDPPMSE